MDPAFLAYLQTLPPAERQAALARALGQEPQMQGSMADVGDVMRIGEVNDQIGDAEKSQLRAQALRNTPGAEGRSAGGVYTAANPLEHLATIGYQLSGALKDSDAQAKLDALRGDRTKLRTKKWGMQYGKDEVPVAPMPPQVGLNEDYA